MKMGRILLLSILLVCLGLFGCSGKGYTEHDREIYLMDAHEVVNAFGIVLVHSKPARRELIDDGRAALGKLEWFRRKYVHTPLDKDLGLLSDFDKCGQTCSEYIGIQQMRILEGKAEEPSSESDDAAKKLEEEKNTIIGKMVRFGYEGFER